MTGFALWNAQSDVKVDSNFTNGEQIDLAKYGCTAIEVLGNSTLNAAGPGSVHYVFDGQNTGCSSVGLTHENTAPFAWEKDEGVGKVACASTLKLPGTPSLKVTPYSGDNCTGTAGTPVTLLFEVVAPPGSGSSDTLGQPGRPFLVP